MVFTTLRFGSRSSHQRHRKSMDRRSQRPPETKRMKVMKPPIWNHRMGVLDMNEGWDYSCSWTFKKKQTKRLQLCTKPQIAQLVVETVATYKTCPKNITQPLEVWYTNHVEEMFKLCHFSFQNRTFANPPLSTSFQNQTSPEMAITGPTRPIFRC